MPSDRMQDRRAVAIAEERAREAQARLEEISAALLDANQSLARVPAIEHRLKDSERERTELTEANERRCEELDRLREELDVLREDRARAWDRVAAFESSRSWRLTAPLRRFGAAFRRG